MSGGIQIKNEKRGEAYILHLDGRLDAVSSPILEETIAEYAQKAPRSILLDFSRVEYLSSAGLRVLLSNSKKMKASGGSLVIFGMTDEVMEIIKMAGFEKVLTLATSESDALNK